MREKTVRIPVPVLEQLGLVQSPDGSWRVPVPRTFNIAKALVSDKAKGPLADKVAVIAAKRDGTTRSLTFADLDRQSDALAATLSDRGVQKGDVIAVHMGQIPETIITHLAGYKLGAIVATMSSLYGPDTLRHILQDSGAKTILTQEETWAPFRSNRFDFPFLRTCIVVGEPAQDELSFATVCARDARAFAHAETLADDPALLIYTSGSTGRPKGILHAHRILVGYRPTLELFFNLELREPDLVFWTPADWAWIGGFVDVVYPALLFGHCVIATPQRFDAREALEIMDRFGVTHTLMTPTALRRLTHIRAPHEGRALKLRTIFTGGEALSGETYTWLRDELRVVCNEGYGLSEVNHMIGNCQKLAPVKPGSMGWDFPAHRAALVDEEGNEVADGEVGEIVVDCTDPTLFLGYWRQPELTSSLRLGRWVRTYDLAVRDSEGYYWYKGRQDDLIKSAGYRIGPAEIEDALAQHASVAEAAVIGIPDADRGHVVKAFVKLAPGWSSSDTLVLELQDHVRARLAAYKYPRIIEFIDTMPLTSTGKISRKELRSREARRESK